MSLSLIRAALEARLAGMTPALPTVLENGETYTPEIDVAYQQAFLLPAAPDNPTLGEAYRREAGVFQVSLMYPQQLGTSDAEARAVAVQARFARGLRVSASPLTVLILRTPEIHPGRQDGPHWRVDVSIRYQAEVFG